MISSFISVVVFSLATAQSGGGESKAQTSAEPRSRALRQMIDESKLLEPLVKTEWVRKFLAGVPNLPDVGKRILFKDEKKLVYFSPTQAATLGSEYRESLVPTEASDLFYYYTRYGSPLAYARPLDLLGQNGFSSPAEKKILDFGYGSVGHLRLLAAQGALVVGVEVDPLLKTLYSDPSDQGSVVGKGGVAGSLLLLHGKFPAESQVKSEVGTGYDLIISKNTLKMGYLHPSRPADERHLIKIGVDDATFVKTLYDILKPGGMVMIYNLSPAPSPPDKPFIPWSDGRCPFDRELIEKTGFKVIAFDKDDSDAARQLGHALGWDIGNDPMDLQRDLFAGYTLLLRPAAAKKP